MCVCVCVCVYHKLFVHACTVHVSEVMMLYHVHFHRRIEETDVLKQKEKEENSIASIKSCSIDLMMGGKFWQMRH